VIRIANNSSAGYSAKAESTELPRAASAHTRRPVGISANLIIANQRYIDTRKATGDTAKNNSCEHTC